MERRIILAIAVSMFIILAFQYLAPKGAKQIPTAKMAPSLAQPAATKQEISSYPSVKPGFEEKYVEAQTNRYILTFSNVGGAIKKISLKDYKNLNSNEPLELVDIKDPSEYIFSLSGQADSHRIDLAEHDIRKTDSTITCAARAGDLEISKRYILHNSKHGIELQLTVNNMSGSAVDLNYRIIGGAGIKEAGEQDKRFVEITSKIDNKFSKFKPPKRGRITIPGTVNWIALKNKYFSLILKPLITTKEEFYSENNDNELAMGVSPSSVTIPPRSSMDSKFILYAGPSHIPTLKDFGYELEETVNYGFFGGITKTLISLMRFIYKIVQNWGMSIIILAVFLNIVLFPITAKSFKSMQKMQELHPQMEKLKTQHKDNPQKLNKEIMELYKKYNINPFSGCLPLLLQMPIFFALYQALLKSVELRGAGFLWVKDLSSPEAIKLPLSFPIIGDSINLLPILMVAAMFIQQKMSTASMGSAVTDEQKQQQKIMLIVMPIMFGFIFYNMPSGLVLYWFINTILTIIEQVSILKRA